MEKTVHTKYRRTDLDALRVIAMFFVIFNHTPAYLVYSKFGARSFSYWISMCVSIFTNFNVPLFFLISGALLLKKTEEIRDILCHRVLWRALSLIVFSLISYIQQVILGYRPADSRQFLITFYTTAENGAYWFLYSYLAFLLCLPFIRRMARNMTRKEYWYFFILCMIFDSIYRILTYVVTKDTLYLNPQFNINWITTNFIFYSLMGYFLEVHIPQEKERTKFFDSRILILLMTTVGAVALTAALVWLRCRFIGDKENDWTDWFHLFKPLYAATMYVLVRRFDRKLLTKSGPDGLQRLRSCLRFLGEHVFAVYLIHAIYLRVPQVYAIYEQLCLFLGENILSGFLYTIIIYILSLLTAIPLRRIPGLKKIL